MAFQSLYRRFRPQRFGEVIGQPHLVNALQNAVAEDRVGHAYLLSGPRGTGKTSTARILAKALNCENLGADGEPCGECQSCTAVEAGNSMDLVELDAASNNRVENVRELTANAALASPGRRKVYLLDEVHMLSTAASNALLKTLEEPPGHVVFILATTDPQKVLPTIRSRTQHVELQLVSADELAGHVRAIADRAGFEATADIVDYVVSRGAGSVRDTLSALDQVVAAGGVPDERGGLDLLLEALAQGDLTASLGAVAAAVAAGVDARDLAERCGRRLRDMFLVAAGVDPGQLPPAEVESLAAQAQTMGRPINVRALELIGGALVDMRQAPDPRLTFEVALVRLFADGTPTPAGGGSADLAALLARIEAIETQLQAGAASGPPPVGARPLPGSADLASAMDAVSVPANPPASPAPTAGAGAGPSAARAALAEARGTPSESPKVAPPQAEPPSGTFTPPPPPPPPPPMGRSAPSSPPPSAAAPSPAPAPPESSPAPPPPPAAEAPSPSPAPDAHEPEPPASEPPPPEASSVEAPSSAPDEVVPHSSTSLSHGLIAEKWPDVLARLSPRARARFQVAVFQGVHGSVATFELPNEPHRDRCEQVRVEVEATLAELIGASAELRLTAGNDDAGSANSTERGPMTPTPPEGIVPADDVVDLDQLQDVPPDGRSTVERLTDAFPGATIVDDDGSM